MAGGVTGLLSGLTPVLREVSDAVNNIAETVSPGSTEGRTTTGNILNENGVVGDVITGVETGDLTGAVKDVYDDIKGEGGIVHNLGDGNDAGTEGLVDNVLGTADGFLGTADGLADGVLGGGDGLSS